eukprot:4965520-Pleurochrysis_carterae.AAC.1
MFLLSVHAGHMRLPGRLSAAPRFATYRTGANFWHARCEPSPAPSVPAVRTEPRQPQPGATVETPAPQCAATSAPRTACIDLRITSNPCALVASRTARLSDRHARNQRNQGRHIGFVVDGGGTYHIHPHMQDLVNVRHCTESVSGVDGKPRPCVAVGDLPLSVRDSQNRIVEFTLTDVRCVPSM